MIVKIIYKKHNQTPAVVFFEGDRVYKEYIDNYSEMDIPLYFINDKSNKKEFCLFICKGERFLYKISTNETVYLLNDEGKTIERLN